VELWPRRRPAQKPRKSHLTPHQPKHPRMPDPTLHEDTVSTSSQRARQHNDYTRLSRGKGDSTNVRRPTAETGTSSSHPYCCPGSCRAPTPHQRTPHAGTARTHTSRYVPRRSPETSLVAYGSRARATVATRLWPVHMAWDREVQQSTPW